MWRLLETIYLFEKISKAFILLDNWWYFGQRVSRVGSLSVQPLHCVVHRDTPPFHLFNRCFSEMLLHRQVKDGTYILGGAGS